MFGHGFPYLNTCKSALNPAVVYSTDRSKAVIPVLVLLFDALRFGGPGVSLTLCCFVVYSTRRVVLCLTFGYFILTFFSPFSIAITSLGEERANFSAFRTFVRFALVWFCLFPLPLGVWEGRRFVILPGLFSYPFFWGGRGCCIGILLVSVYKYDDLVFRPDILLSASLLY